MRAFASRICSEFKQIELNWNRIVHQNALWSLVFSSTRPWNKQISAPDASQPSSQERWQVADLKHFKISYIFSLPRISTKDFPYIKGKIDRSIGINYSSVNFQWTQVFLCCQSFDRRGRGFTDMACKIFDGSKLVPCKNSLRKRAWKFVEIVQNRIGTLLTSTGQESKNQLS